MTGTAAVTDSDRASASSAAPLATVTRCITTLPALERELHDGLLQSWHLLVERDPLASCFQAPGWCLPWYRSYHDEFDPFVIVVTAVEGVIGLVPLAVRRASGEIMFASGTMADYRDIVCLPTHREAVVAALLRAYLSGDFPNPLELGWLDPASPTAAVVERVCREWNLPFLVRRQPCYRWVPPPPAKPSAQKFLNWYKRKGTVSFDVVETAEDFKRFREEYYTQHSLRQIQAGRDTVFNDPRRAAFYDALFHSADVQTHITAFRVDGAMLAGHFGYVWRGVLLFGPPAIRLEDEQRSPAVILLSWIIQNAARLGLTGFDLTIGDTDFKKRLGNQCVPVTQIEIFKDQRSWRLRRGRMETVAIAKGVVAAVGGHQAWPQRVKPAAAWLRRKKRRVAEEGIATAARAVLQSALGAVHVHRVGLVYAIEPGQLRPAAPRTERGRIEVHENRVEDLLLSRSHSSTTAEAITTLARSYARLRSSNRTLHTMLVDGQLACWGHSYYPNEPADLSETPGATLTFEPGSVSLYDFHTVPEFRGRRLYQALLTAILEQRFAEGASRAYITVLESNIASRVAIERVGFQLVRRDEYRRLLRTASLTQQATGR